MKTFEDLELKPHPLGNGLQAGMDFDNGYGISVIGFPGKGQGQVLWEVAIIYKGSITYDTPITEDVLSYQSESDVSAVMKQIQEL